MRFAITVIYIWWTHVYVDRGQREHSGVRQLFGNETKKFLSTFVPFHRVQGLLFQVVVAPHYGRTALSDRYRHFDVHVLQTAGPACNSTGTHSVGENVFRREKTS